MRSNISPAWVCGLFDNWSCCLCQHRWLISWLNYLLGTWINCPFVSEKSVMFYLLTFWHNSVTFDGSWDLFYSLHAEYVGLFCFRTVCMSVCLSVFLFMQQGHSFVSEQWQWPLFVISLYEYLKTTQIRQVELKHRCGGGGFARTPSLPPCAMVSAR
jgi:hypothetical protein